MSAFKVIETTIGLWADAIDQTAHRSQVPSVLATRILIELERDGYTIIAPVAYADVALFKQGGKYYTTEKWRIPPDATRPDDMRRSPDFHRVDSGPVLVESQDPWGYPCLIT